MNKEIIISILRMVVCCNESADYMGDNDIDWYFVWDFAIRNHIEVILYKYIKNNNISISSELLNEIELTYYNRVSAAVIQDECLKQIESILQSEKISYALQKGSVLKDDYPVREMRFMSDVDIYINSDDRSKIHQCMVANGLSFKGTESGDEQFLHPDKVGIEFHGRLLYRKTKYGIENYPAWDFVNETTNRLTEEGFALNLIGHAVGDLAKGGPGIRYILDLWIYRHRHFPQPEWRKVDERLIQDNIYDAAYNLINLSEYLFGDLEPSEKLIEFKEYVLSGGLHGDRNRASAIEIAIAGGKKKAALYQIFRNRIEYENRYLWVKKHPILMPLAYVKRLFESFRKNKRTITKWKKSIHCISHDEVVLQKEQLKKWGL